MSDVAGGDQTLVTLDAGEVLLVQDDFGLLVRGASDDVALTIDELLGRLPESHRASISRTAVTDTAVLATSGVALASTSGEYVRLTAESLAKVREFGEQYDASGALRGYVRNAKGQYAGQLSFEQVNLAAEQALALQTLAMSMALRTAIANVQQAVERVEGKVDAIDRRLVSRTLGDVIGTFRMLTRICDETSARGRLLSADWDSVAAIGHKVQTDLEALRDDARVRVGELAAGLSIPKRVDKLEDFQKRGDLTDILNLILVLEQSLHLWEYLRLQHIARTDSDHLQSAHDGARRMLHEQSELDVELVEALTDAIDAACVVKPLEIHHVFSLQALGAQARAVHAAVRSFAEAGRLPVPAELGELSVPKPVEARDEIKDRAVVAGRAAKELSASAGSATGDILKRGSRQVRGTVKVGVRKVDPRKRSRAGAKGSVEPQDRREDAGEHPEWSDE